MKPANQSRPAHPLGTPRHDLLTVAAIAALAFMLADIAHEVVGHGSGFLLAGGRSGIFTTTRLLETKRLGESGGNLFDLGGPAGNLSCALIARMLQRSSVNASTAMRLLLLLTMAFSLFWAFGYLLFCGVFARGDWFALIQALPYDGLWRVLFVIAAILLYAWSIRLVGTQLINLGLAGSDNQHLILTSYLAAGAIASAGAAFDPRGPMEILNSGALSSLAAAVGLLQIPRLIRNRRRELPAISKPVPRSPAWLGAFALASIFYVFVLGPGISFAL